MKLAAVQTSWRPCQNAFADSNSCRLHYVKSGQALLGGIITFSNINSYQWRCRFWSRSHLLDSHIQWWRDEVWNLKTRYLSSKTDCNVQVSRLRLANQSSWANPLLSRNCIRRRRRRRASGWRRLCGSTWWWWHPLWRLQSYSRWRIWLWFQNAYGPWYGLIFSQYRLDDICRW